MKKFKNYKIILGITFVFIFINLYVVLYQGRIEPPNNSWSKEILIESIELPDHYTDAAKDDIELLKIEKYYYLVYFSRDSLYLNQYDTNFDLMDSEKISKSISTVDDLHVYQNQLSNLNIKFLENTKLHSLTVDLNGKIIKNSVDAYNVQKVKYIGNNILYSKFNTLFLNYEKIVALDRFIDLSLVKKEEAFYINYINLNPNTLKHELYSLKVVNGNIVSSKLLNEFSLKTSTIVIDLGSTSLDEMMTIMVVIHDEKKNEFFNDGYKVSYDLNILDKTRKNSLGYQFSFIGQGSQFIQKDMTPIEIRDLSTAKERFPNIVLYDGDQEMKLTSTKRFPNKTNYYRFDNGKHLLFSQLRRNEVLDIYVSSTVPSHLEKSQILKAKDYFDLGLATLTTFFPLFIFGQTHSLLFLVPIFLIVVPFTVVKINWSEWNPNKVLSFAIFLFLLSKTIYLVFFINPSSLPDFLTSTGVRLAIAYLLSGIAIISMIDYSGKIRNHFYADFFTFFVFDMVTFTLFFSPYLLL